MRSPLSHFLISLAVCVVVIVGYGAWYAVVSAKSSAVASLQNTIDTKTDTMNRIAATRTALADVASSEAVVQDFFVPEIGIVAFIDSFETRGKTLGATVNVLSVSTEGTATKPSLAFSFTIAGTFDAVMRMLGAIEYAPYALSISDLSIAQGEKGSWHADIKLLVGSVPAERAAATSSSSGALRTSTL